MKKKKKKNIFEIRNKFHVKISMIGESAFWGKMF